MTRSIVFAPLKLICTQSGKALFVASAQPPLPLPHVAPVRSPSFTDASANALPYVLDANAVAPFAAAATLIEAPPCAALTVCVSALLVEPLLPASPEYAATIE